MSSNKPIQPTKLNDVQLQLLQLFNRPMSREETLALKKHIARFFYEKMTTMYDELYESGEITDQGWEAMTKKHPKRTPYPAK